MRQKVFPLLTVRAPSASNSLSALSAQLRISRGLDNSLPAKLKLFVLTLTRQMIQLDFVCYIIIFKYINSCGYHMTGYIEYKGSANV